MVGRHGCVHHSDLFSREDSPTARVRGRALTLLVGAGRAAQRGGRRRSSHIGYTCRMSEVASRELRNSTRSLLDRVAAGESLTITVDGRPVAVLGPVGRRPRWVPRAKFAATILANQADSTLAADLDDLAGEMTDDLPLS